ncbi:MAG: T3SS (YopN, CesT) and YbjN peptide-binding chaperone 1 [Acidimicrobiales bacterium]
MAKTRFDWSALPARLLGQLEKDLGVDDDARLARVLVKRFGSRPTETFVKETWTALRDSWIAKDPAVRRAVVTALRARGLGSPSIAGSSARAEVQYLRSCRNSPSLRAIVLPHLLGLGEHSQPVASKPKAPPRSRTKSPAGVLSTLPGLRTRVHAVVQSVLGLDQVLFDNDGDIPIRSHASVTYVRVLPDAPVVRVFSPVLWDLGSPNDIEETLNDINRRTNWVKAIWDNGTVLLFSDVVGDPLAEAQLAAAINSVVQRADEVGPALQQRYGGRTAFSAPLPPRHLPTGGYL